MKCYRRFEERVGCGGTGGAAPNGGNSTTEAPYRPDMTGRGPGHKIVEKWRSECVILSPRYAPYRHASCEQAARAPVPPPRSALPIGLFRLLCSRKSSPAPMAVS